ncbi:hypothetical protein H0H93_011303 [Arthromyces matolae]|nr:hypothetical protein H0H93_011303 [Arthromyces matolae]
MREEISEAKRYQEEIRRQGAEQLREGKELDLERASGLLTEVPTDQASSSSIPASPPTSNAELPTNLTSTTSSPPPSFDDSVKAITESESTDNKNKKEGLKSQRRIVQLRRTPLKRS